MNAGKYKKACSYLIDGGCFIAGSVLFAVSVNVFTAPNDIAPGGLTGIATMLNYLFQTPIGTTILVMNIPLFLWGLFAMGYRFILRTAVSTLLCSIAIDVFSLCLTPYHGDTILAALFGGVLAGLGLGLIFIRGGTTGGTDLVANLIARRVRHISLGRLVLAVDLVVVIASAFVFRNLESPLYALVTIFVTSKVIDAVMYGADSGAGKMMFIISNKNQEIADAILHELGRGVTELKSRGGYSGIEGEVLLCAVSRQEVYKIHDIAHRADPKAFIIVGEAGEITGEGFRENRAEKKKEKN
jgi:uncharacterized membrane-anchored protein YitT (DUF2179 family)